MSQVHEMNTFWGGHVCPFIYFVFKPTSWFFIKFAKDSMLDVGPYWSNVHLTLHEHIHFIKNCSSSKKFVHDIKYICLYAVSLKKIMQS